MPGSPSSSTSWRWPSAARAKSSVSRRARRGGRRTAAAARWRRTRSSSSAGGPAAAADGGGAGAGGRLLRLLGLQQPLELGLDLRAGRDAELVAQQRAQPVVHAQRLDEVALRLAHPHQQQVAALAERRALDQLGGGALGVAPARRRRARGPRRRAARAPAGRGPPAAAAGPPATAPRSRAAARRRRAVGHLVGGLDHVGPLTGVARRERAVERGLDVVEVNLRDRDQLHGALAGVLDHARAERPAQLREDDVERLRVPGGRVLAPQRSDQPFTRDWSARVEREIGDGQSPLASGEVALTPTPIDRNRQLAAKLDGHFRG